MMLNIRWLNPRLYQILQTRYKYLRVAQAFKNQFSSEKAYSCKLDLKRLKHAPGSRVGLSVFIYTPNSKPQAAQITKSLFSSENSYWHLPRKIFQNNYLEFTLKEDFFQSISRFSFRTNIATRNSSANSSTMLGKKIGFSWRGQLPPLPLPPPPPPTM